MSIFDQLPNTFAHLDNTPDRPSLSLVAREGLGGSHRLQAWESPSVRRLRQALQLLRDQRAHDYVREVDSVLGQIQASAQILWQPELADAVEAYPELHEDIDLAADLLDELVEAGQPLRNAPDHRAAAQALSVFMEIFSTLDQLEDRLVLLLADAA